ncbi:ANTAR domain-containing protein [Luteimicrobium sp. DT211]|uniref:ANTAR domain-containing protein n=1 Tax=Luteimicrobium sp. DT211 TaxID=3393412 RepID=UPI003CE955BC
MADNRSAVLAQLAHAVAAAADVPLPVRLTRACVDILGADGAAITLASTSPERLTVTTSDGISARIEDLQDVLGEGPGQVAFVEGRTVVTQIDGDRGGAFPLFMELAGEISGPLTVFAIPMRPSRVVIGVLTLYSAEATLARTLTDAQFLADAVGAALLGDPDLTSTESFELWSDRARVHQATGMVVAQLRIPPEDALALLRAHAFAEAVSLDEISASVVSRRLAFGSDHRGAPIESHGESHDDTETEEP